MAWIIQALIKNSGYKPDLKRGEEKIIVQSPVTRLRAFTETLETFAWVGQFHPSERERYLWSKRIERERQDAKVNQYLSRIYDNYVPGRDGPNL